MNYYKFLPKRAIKLVNESDLSRQHTDAFLRFGDKYIHSFYGKSGPKPDFNPYQGFIFDVGKQNIDLFTDFIGFRGLICSKRMMDILKNCTLPKNKVFHDLDCQKTKFSYVFFYESCVDHLDFSRSRFISTPKHDDSYVSNIVDNVHQFKIVNDNIQVKNFDDLKKLEEFYTKQNLAVRLIEACLPKHQDHDILTLYNQSESIFYISERLKSIMESKKVNGYDAWSPNMVFKCS